MKIVVLITVLAVMMFQVLECQDSLLSPLTEDSNGNTLPDIVELQKGTFISYVTPIITVYAMTITFTIILIVTLITLKAIIPESIDYRNDFDFFAKIFKSKLRGWCDVKWFYTFCVLAVLLCGLVLVASAQKNSNNPFAEDSDGDGLPSVVETQVGTDPDNPYSCIYVQGISDVGVNEIQTNKTKIEIVE